MRYVASKGIAPTGTTFSTRFPNSHRPVRLSVWLQVLYEGKHPKVLLDKSWDDSDGMSEADRQSIMYYSLLKHEETGTNKERVSLVPCPSWCSHCHRDVDTSIFPVVCFESVLELSLLSASPLVLFSRSLFDIDFPILVLRRVTPEQLQKDAMEDVMGGLGDSKSSNWLGSIFGNSSSDVETNREDREGYGQERGGTLFESALMGPWSATGC